MAHQTVPASLPCVCTPVPQCVDVVAAATEDPTISAGVLTIPSVGETRTINYFDIVDIDLTCAATAVAQVNTIAPSSFTVGTCCGSSAVYEIQLSQVQCEDVVIRTYNVDVNADTTAAEIVDSFVAQINADSLGFVTAADTGSTFTLTADTAGCAFNVDYITDNLVNIATTANVVGAGQSANLTYDGVPAANFSTSATYHTLDITYRSFVVNPVKGCEDCYKACEEFCRLFVVNDSDGDAWLTAFYDITDGTATASGYLAKSGTNPAC
jgi:phage tail sheath gpL-like